MSSPYSALAAKVREKYPDAYKDMSDEQLGKAVIAKYPQYGDMVKASSTPSSTPGGYKAGETPNPLTRASEIITGSPHPIDELKSEIPYYLHHPGEYLKGAAELPFRMASQAMLHPVQTATSLTGGPEFAEDIKARRYGSAAADVGAGALNAFGMAKGAEGARPMAEGTATGLNRLGVPSDLGGVHEALHLPEWTHAGPTHAQKLYEIAVAPTGAKVSEQSNMRESWKRAAPYIADETRGRPIRTGEGGAFRAVGRLQAIQNRLWDQHVAPVVNEFGNYLRSGSPVAQTIRDSFDPFDKANKPSAVKAGDKLADFYDRPMSVSEMATNLKKLNADKGVSQFYSLDPNAQAQLVQADPAIHGKLVARRVLADTLFQAVEDLGGERLGNSFKEVRKDYGALNSMEDQLLNMKVPTPEGIGRRLINTARGVLHPFNVGSTGGYMRVPLDTFLRVNNPNNLVPNAFNILGRSDLTLPKGPDVVVKPPRGLLPPPGGTSEGKPPFGGIRGKERGLTERGPVPGGPSTKLPPRTGYEAANPADRGEALARIPGRSYRVPPGTDIRTPPPGYSTGSTPSVTSQPVPEVEAHVAGLVRAGKLSRGEVMRMVRKGILGQGAATRIFKQAGSLPEPPEATPRNVRGSE